MPAPALPAIQELLNMDYVSGHILFADTIIIIIIMHSYFFKDSSKIWENLNVSLRKKKVSYRLKRV